MLIVPIVSQIITGKKGPMFCSEDYMLHRFRKKQPLMLILFLLVREKIRSPGFWRISEISVYIKFIHLHYAHLKNYRLFVVIS